jgi:hypothetical protein
MQAPVERYSYCYVSAAPTGRSSGPVQQHFYVTPLVEVDWKPAK